MTDDIRKRVHTALQTTWQQIGGDILQVAKDMDGKNDVDRATVIEVTLDCSYAENFGDDKEAIAELRKLPYKEQEKIAKETFKFKRYGW